MKAPRDKRRFHYIGESLEDADVRTPTKPTPYERRLMELRPIPGISYTELPVEQETRPVPVPVWKYIECFGMSHFDRMVQCGRLVIVSRGNANYCIES